MELSNPQHESFAQNVASGLSLTQSAIRAGYKESAAHNSGSRLAQSKRVSSRIQELRSTQGAYAPCGAGIRNPQSRVSALEDRWHRMRMIILARSEDPELQEIPGGKTGLLVKQVKQIGAGEKAQTVTTFVLDREILVELREHERQAAEELGQWTTRKETYNSSVSLSLSDPQALSDAIHQQLSQLPESDRAILLNAAPPELAAAIRAESEAVVEPNDGGE